jgi:hypothetical protein
MSKQETEMAQSVGEILKAIVGPLLDRLERLETKAAPPPGPNPNEAPDETFRRMMASLRGTDQDRVALVEVVEGCVSDTGAKFNGELQHGVLVAMRDYTLPAASEVHVKDGGLVPDGMALGEVAGHGQWKYEQFYLADARRFVGKPLPAWMRAEAVRAKAAAAPVAQTA